MQVAKFGTHFNYAGRGRDMQLTLQLERGQTSRNPVLGSLVVY